MIKLNYYAILGVPKHASHEDIKQAYRKLAMQHHPDRNDNSELSAEVFKSVQNAFDHLSDPVKRKEHDEVLMGVRPPPVENGKADAQGKGGSTPEGSSHKASQAAYARTHAKRQAEEKKTSSLKKFLIFLFFVIAGGSVAGLMYLQSYTPPHSGMFDAAIPSFMNKVEPNVLETQARSQVISITDYRVDAVMGHLYGQNIMQKGKEKCWMAGSYCMQPFSSFLVETNSEQFLYLLTIDRDSELRLHQRRLANQAMVFGSATFDMRNLRLISQSPYSDYPESFSQLAGGFFPTQIACNGAYGWQGSLNNKQVVLLAQQGNVFVNVWKDLPPQYLDKGQYQRTFIYNRDECAYQMSIKHMNDSTKSRVTATFDSSSWSYKTN